MRSALSEHAPKRYAIVYYSRVGHTDRLARQLAEALDADLFRIIAGRYTGNALGYTHAGFDSLTGRFPPIAPIPNLSEYTSVSLGAPNWTSYPARPLRAYLAARPQRPEAVGVFTTSGGNAVQDKAFSMARRLLGHPIVATLNIANSLGVPETENRIFDFCEAQLSAAHAAPSA